MSDVTFSYSHSPPLSLSHPFCPLLSVVSASAPQLAPTPFSPRLRLSSPTISLHQGSCSLIQLGRCNLLKKKTHNLVNHTSRGSGLGGEGGDGYQQLRAQV